MKKYIIPWIENRTMLLRYKQMSINKGHISTTKRLLDFESQVLERLSVLLLI